MIITRMRARLTVITGRTGLLAAYSLAPVPGITATTADRIASTDIAMDTTGVDRALFTMVTASTTRNAATIMALIVTIIGAAIFTEVLITATVVTGTHTTEALTSAGSAGTAADIAEKSR